MKKISLIFLFVLLFLAIVLAIAPDFVSAAGELIYSAYYVQPSSPPSLEGQEPQGGLAPNSTLEIEYTLAALCTSSTHRQFYAVRNRETNIWAAHGEVASAQFRYRFATLGPQIRHTYYAIAYCWTEDLLGQNPNLPPERLNPSGEAWTSPLFQQTTVGRVGDGGVNREKQPQYIKLINPLKFNGFEIKTPGELVVKVFQGFALIIGAIAIAFTVYSGFKLVIAANEESIKSAKDSITWSVAGFIVSLLAFTTISGAAKLLGFEPSLINFNEDRIDTVLTGPTNPRDFISVMNFIMVGFLGLVGFATTFMIIYYGYRYLTSAGNEEQIEQAKSGLRWALIGFAVVFLAFTIISAVRQLLLVGPPGR